MPHILALSPELLHQICAHLDRPALHSLTLTCRKLQLCAEITLYREMTVTVVQAVRMFQLFDKFPKLADRVESLTITEGPYDYAMAPGWDDKRKPCKLFPEWDHQRLSPVIKNMLNEAWNYDNYSDKLLDTRYRISHELIAELLPRLTTKVSRLTMSLNPRAGTCAFKRRGTFPSQYPPLWFPVLDQLHTLEMEFSHLTWEFAGLAIVLRTKTLKTLTLNVPYLYDSTIPRHKLVKDFREVREGCAVEELNLKWLECESVPVNDGPDCMVAIISPVCRRLKRFTLQRQCDEGVYARSLHITSRLRKNCPDLEAIELWNWDESGFSVDLGWFDDFARLKRVVVPAWALHEETLWEIGEGEKETVDFRGDWLELVRAEDGFQFSRYMAQGSRDHGAIVEDDTEPSYSVIPEMKICAACICMCCFLILLELLSSGIENRVQEVRLTIGWASALQQSVTLP
ncbi:uncharacterized protein EI97DRAFT_458816 [Westerdykella ornata]|uniref:F-box domain-containing protein n=1 Tax=Westerdykella ornata TaxID=318751 RepID=A0A6A6JI94_WESOR|nr:uncharacterized protein EI97DRAFT_458816 [Westerdykella ornata]KAF2275803.1 hypothetical protein EI97DRAFT_458816 [Westerdykella ornata]